MKMRRILISLLMLCSLSAFALTDQQVIDYIKQQSAAGKSEQQIGKELLAKGVTPEQAKRIKAMYEAQQKNNDSQSQTGFQQNGNRQNSQYQQNNRTHSRVENNNPNYNYNTDLNFPNNNDNFNQNNQNDLLNSDQNLKQIYGHQVFNNKSLTFEPSENLATPQNYRLGPGDEVIIDIWGTSEDHLRQTISPEGSIMISQLGPVYLNGMTINDANKHI